jgi:hypothetical protein
VLGRKLYPSEESLADAWRDALKSVKTRFPGPLTAIVKSAQTAQVCKDAGVRTIVLDEKGWASVTLGK